MAKVTFRKTTAEDVKIVEASLRDADRKEALAVGVSPEAMVRICAELSDTAITGVINGEVAMVLGVRERVYDGSAEIWALSTAVCFSAPLAMVKVGRKVVQSFLKEYNMLENHCHAEYKSSLRWLKLMGFNIGEPEPYRDKGAMFCHVWIER